MRTGLELRVSGAVSTASGLAKPCSFRSSAGIACSKTPVIRSGRTSCRSQSVTPGRYVGRTLPSVVLARCARKSPARCAAALAENADAAHIAPVCGDRRQLCTAGPEQGQYDFAACNPPYFTAGPRSPDPRRAEARHTGSCTTADAVDCARRALRDGGRFLLCQRPEQLAEILAALRAARLEPKRLAFVKNRPDAAPWLFLVEAQKGRKTGLRVEPDILIQSGAALYGPNTL